MYQSTKNILAKTKEDLKKIVEADKKVAYAELINFLTEELKSLPAYTRDSKK